MDLNRAREYDLLLRIKHRLAISAEAFTSRLDELELITTEQATRFKIRIRAEYHQNHFAQPDASCRILSPNGRLSDVPMTARAPAPHPELPALRTLLNETGTPL